MAAAFTRERAALPGCGALAGPVSGLGRRTATGIFGFRLLGGGIVAVPDAYAALDRGGAVGRGPGAMGGSFGSKFLEKLSGGGGYAGCRDGWPTGSTLNLLSCANAHRPSPLIYPISGSRRPHSRFGIFYTSRQFAPSDARARFHPQSGAARSVDRLASGCVNGDGLRCSHVRW